MLGYDLSLHTHTHIHMLINAHVFQPLIILYGKDLVTTLRDLPACVVPLLLVQMRLLCNVNVTSDNEYNLPGQLATH